MTMSSAVSQEAVIASSDEVLRKRVQSLEAQHQERLESLTNKCLVFEEELGELVVAVRGMPQD